MIVTRQFFCNTVIGLCEFYTGTVCQLSYRRSVNILPRGLVRWIVSICRASGKLAVVYQHIDCTLVHVNADDVISLQQ